MLSGAIQMQVLTGQSKDNDKALENAGKVSKGSEIRHYILYRQLFIRVPYFNAYIVLDKPDKI